MVTTIASQGGLLKIKSWHYSNSPAVIEHVLSAEGIDCPYLGRKTYYSAQIWYKFPPQRTHPLTPRCKGQFKKVIQQTKSLLYS